MTGDAANNPAPTYATFNKLGAGTDAGKTTDRTGQHVSATLAATAAPPTTPAWARACIYAHFVAESGHNIPDAFWDWLQKQPDWVTLMGYPISEPYWVRATVAGKPDQPGAGADLRAAHAQLQLPEPAGVARRVGQCRPAIRGLALSGPVTPGHKKSPHAACSAWAALFKPDYCTVSGDHPTR